MKISVKFSSCHKQLLNIKAALRGDLWRWSMQQIYRRNHILAWVFSCKFCGIFSEPLFQRSALENLWKTLLQSNLLQKEFTLSLHKSDVKKRYSQKHLDKVFPSSFSTSSNIFSQFDEGNTSLFKMTEQR